MELTGNDVKTVLFISRVCLKVKNFLGKLSRCGNAIRNTEEGVIKNACTWAGATRAGQGLPDGSEYGSRTGHLASSNHKIEFNIHQRTETCLSNHLWVVAEWNAESVKAKAYKIVQDHRYAFSSLGWVINLIGYKLCIVSNMMCCPKNKART